MGMYSLPIFPFILSCQLIEIIQIYVRAFSHFYFYLIFLQGEGFNNKYIYIYIK